MTEISTETTAVEDVEQIDTPEDVQPVDTPEGSESESDPETFPREVVEKLRQENGKYRQRAQQASEASDLLARRLHLELVRATGRLADPSDLEFAEEHLEDPDALAAAVDELLERKPHLASRKIAGDVGQGNRGSSSEPFSLLGMLKERT